jgi:hypothetical protein
VNNRVLQWATRRNAPPPGTPLCPLLAIASGTVRQFDFGEPDQAFSMLLVRHDDLVAAYLNLCPHQWLPLTFRSDPRRFLTLGRWGERRPPAAGSSGHDQRRDRSMLPTRLHEAT